MDAAEVLVSHKEAWTMEKLKAVKVLMHEVKITEPFEVHGVVEFPIWDFLEVKYYIYPVLHGEIGLVNGAVDGLYSELDDNVEKMSSEEKTARNHQIIADIARDAAVQKTFNDSEEIEFLTL